MDIPILGTINFTPSGLFLFFAAVIAVGYFGYQLFGTGRAGRDAKKSEETPQVAADAGAADDVDDLNAEIDEDERPKDQR